MAECITFYLSFLLDGLQEAGWFVAKFHGNCTTGAWWGK